MARRKHSKILELPVAIKAAVDTLLAHGHTYDQIAEELQRRGYTIGKSSVGRYAKDVAEAARELNLVTEQLKPVLAQVKDSPNLELGSVAVQMGLMQVIGFLRSERIEDEKSRAAALSSVCAAAAMLQRSQALTEKYRLDWQAKAQAAMEKLQQLEGAEKLSDKSLRQIRDILGLKA